MSELREAAGINAHACEFCPAVHINFRDAAGETFATASVPLHHVEPLIAQIRAAAQAARTRLHAAPARRQ